MKKFLTKGNRFVAPNPIFLKNLIPIFLFSKIVFKKMTKTYDKNWDIDAYYDETELEEHWQLRREFMRVHKNKFPEDYVVALAKTYTNIEFLGCIYPAPVMIRIQGLMKEVDMIKKYREQRKTRLQRTFVTASNAAENKFSGKKS